MRICLVLEGSYPYVHGGVSTWTHQYISEMAEHEFVLWLIGAKQEQAGQFVYELPKNVIAVQEVFLDSRPLDEKGSSYSLTDEETRAVRDLVFCQDPDWPVIFSMLQEGRITPNQLLRSPEFFTVLTELCEEQYPLLSMADLFHTIRSMLFPLLNLLTSPVPEADVYHAISTGYGGMMARLGSEMQHKPLLLTEHGIYTREREQELIRASWVLSTMRNQWIRFFYLLSSAIYQKADRVTSLFARARQTQLELGCREDQCQVIANGIDYDSLSATPLKKEDGWVDIGAVVRLAPIKDIKTMLYSFYELAKQVPQVRLHIMGGVDDPQYGDECYRLAQKMDLGERLIFTGRVDVRAYMEKIDFTILTSISEGQPLSVLESMAAGRPCVTTDVGCCKDLLEGQAGDDLGLAGYCLPPTDVDGIARALKDMALDRNQRLAMGVVAKKRVASYYQYPQMISQYRRLYEEVG